MDEFITKLLHIIYLSKRNIFIFCNAAKIYIYSINSNMEEYNTILNKAQYCLFKAEKNLNNIEISYMRITKYISKYSLDYKVEEARQSLIISKAYFIEAQIALNNYFVLNTK